MNTESTFDPLTTLRTDVARDRALLLRAADALLAERGLDLTLDDLATEAGVDAGTVHRHFADREQLLETLVAQRLEAMRQAMESAERLQDPVAAFRGAILGVCTVHAVDRAVREALLSDAARTRELAERMLRPVATRIVERAIASGRMRPDVRETDPPTVLLVSGALVQARGGVREDLWQRYVDALLDGLLVREGEEAAAEALAARPIEPHDVLAGARRA